MIPCVCVWRVCAGRICSSKFCPRAMIRAHVCSVLSPFLCLQLTHVLFIFSQVDKFIFLSKFSKDNTLSRNKLASTAIEKFTATSTNETVLRGCMITRSVELATCTPPEDDSETPRLIRSLEVMCE